MMNKNCAPALLLTLGLALGASCGQPGEDFDAIELGALTTSGVSATLRLTSDWTTGYCAEVVVTNGSTAAVTAWSVVVNPNQSTITQAWNSTASGSGASTRLSPLSWNSSLARGATTTIGFCANATGSTYRPVLVSLSVTGGGSGGTAGAGGSGGTAGSGGGGGVATGCPNPGNGGVLNSTVVVRSGQTYDGGCRRFTAGSALGDGSQSESQLPMFRLEDGARLINVVLGTPAADGIHTYGTVTLENVIWQDVGEDALTVKSSGTVTINGGSARAASDKIFQINAASTFRVSNFTATDGGKFIRQNGGTTFKVAVYIDRCDISDMDEAIFRTDSSTSTVSMTNTRYSHIGETLFMGVAPGNITTSNNVQY